MRMTEQEWLACTIAHNMLMFLHDRTPEVWDLPVGRKARSRKLRLFAAGCCRQLWHLLSDERSRRAVEITEECIDGRADHDTRRAAAAGAFDVTVSLRRMREQETVVQPRPPAPIRTLGELIESWAARAGTPPGRLGPEEEAAHVAFRLTAWNSFGGYEAAAGALALSPGAEYRGFCQLLRCVFGNPFRPRAALEVAWKTAPVLALAQAIYDERRFSDLPILGDALEEAGCTSADLLGHCRGPGLHARGCWVVDLILGKG